MGLFDKFRKKKEIDLDEVADKEFADDSSFLDAEEPLQPEPDPLYPSSEPLTRPRMVPSTSLQPPTFTTSENKDLELINSKLDTLKAILYSMDRRLENIEKTLGSEQKNRLW